MKLLLDQPLSRRLVAPLQIAFPGSSHVALHGLDRVDDRQVWQFARVHGFVIATKDEDFQILSFTLGFPPKVVWLRSGNGPSHQVLDQLLRARSILESFDSDQTRSLMILP